jgi:hypothetical protein
LYRVSRASAQSAPHARCLRMHCAANALASCVHWNRSMTTMDVVLLRATDRVQKSLHDAEARGHFSVEALALAAGSLLGAVFGSVAGPSGALAGAIVGGAIGGLSGIGLDRGLRAEDRHARAIDALEAEAERDIAVRVSSLPPPPFAETYAPEYEEGAAPFALTSPRR